MRVAATRRALILGLAGASVFLVTGNELPAAQADLRERTLFVTAVDGMGNPVEGLSQTDLTVREDGVQREVLRMSRATEPIDVAVLVDNASSSDALIPRVREGMKEFVSILTPQNSVTIVALADRPTIVTDYTMNAETLIAGSRRLFTMDRSGATLLDAIVEISGGLRRRETPRAAIVPIVTDGIEYSNRRYQDVVDAVTRSGAGFYPIAVGQFIAQVGEPEHERAVALARTPGASGGVRFDLLSAIAVEATMAKVARHLTSQYKVVYSRPETLIPPEKIEVSTKRPGVKVHGTPARMAAGSGR